jgi:hypothetical protein
LLRYLKSIATANTFAYLSLRDMQPFWPTLRKLVPGRRLQA